MLGIRSVYVTKVRVSSELASWPKVRVVRFVKVRVRLR